MSAQQSSGETAVTGTMVHVVRPGPVPAGHADLSRQAMAERVPMPPASTGMSPGLTIVPTFDSTITSDPNAASIQATINTAIAIIQAQYADPMTVNITFKKMTSGLGQSTMPFFTVPYATFLTALKGDATTAEDATAISLLPSVATNPVDGGTNIHVKSANLRAVGLAGSVASDGTVSLNTTITTPGSPGSPGTYYLLPVVLHEIDEVLGLGSALPLGGPVTTIFPQDLYRYDATGARSFTAVNTPSIFFSINGTSHIAQFDNQNDGGDFGDWQSNPRPVGVPPKVQDAFATPFANPGMSPAEYTALDVIGYNRVVYADPPSITSQPASQTVRPGGTAIFTASASGAPVVYQWQGSGDGGSTWKNLPEHAFYAGVMTSTLTVSGVTIAFNGWRYRCLVMNQAGSAVSDPALLTVLRDNPPSDLDGDGRSDIAVFRPSTGGWFSLQSSSNYAASFSTNWGVAGDIPATGDYDGDGMTDVAIYRPSTGQWWVLQSSSGYTTSFSTMWGTGGDIPVPADYDGDGKTDIAVFRPSTGQWWVLQSNSSFTTFFSAAWGTGGDLPAAGDYDGDGRADIAVFRPSTGTWFVLQSSSDYTTYFSMRWGTDGDVPVPADYDGDGATDIAIYRPSTGAWWVLQSSSGFTAFFSQSWGAGGDIPVPGDFDGDGKGDIAVFRPSTGTWFVLQSNSGYTTYFSAAWGVSTDVPLPWR